MRRTLHLRVEHLAELTTDDLRTVVVASGVCVSRTILVVSGQPGCTVTPTHTCTCG